MTPELWQAKKLVDATLHPGALSLVPYGSTYPLISHRDRRACVFAISHVMLCDIKSGRHSGDAHSWLTGLGIRPLEYAHLLKNLRQRGLCYGRSQTNLSTWPSTTLTPINPTPCPHPSWSNPISSLSRPLAL